MISKVNSKTAQNTVKKLTSKFSVSVFLSNYLAEMIPQKGYMMYYFRFLSVNRNKVKVDILLDSKVFFK